MRIEVAASGEACGIEKFNCGGMNLAQSGLAQLAQGAVGVNRGEAADFGDIGLGQWQGKSHAVRQSDSLEAQVHLAQKVGDATNRIEPANPKEPSTM